MATSEDGQVGRYSSGIRWPALDGLRGAAVLLVMLHHFTLYGMQAPTGGVDELFYTICMATWWGVDVLFVLSGFLITGILVDTKGSKHFFRTFYMRRVLRIFPLYYGFLVLCFLILPRLVSVSRDFSRVLEEQGWYWAYLINVQIAWAGWGNFPAFTHFWSLAIEEQFYLFWPLIVFFFKARQVMVICLACMVGSICVRTALVLTGHSVATYVVTPARIDALAVGAFVALLIREPEWRTLMSTWVRRVCSATAIGIGTLALWKRGLPADDAAVQIVGLTLLALLSGCVIGIALMFPPRTRSTRVLEHPVLTRFGQYSYALYVFHNPIALFMQWSILKHQGFSLVLGSQLPLQIMYIVTGIGVSLGFAALSWHFYESKFLKIKEQFPYTRRTPQPGFMKTMNDEMETERKGG